jgi:GTP-binding protein
MISIQTFHKLFKSEINFVAGADSIRRLPNFKLPQIAFVGKSNVGKSSLINMICGRKTLARVSHTPGRTQQINFFDVGGYFSLVDLPGYGYAKVSGHTRANWEKLITYYLFNKRPNLINLLIDARRGMKEHDSEVADMIVDNRVNFQIILTKCDEIKDREIVADATRIFIKGRYNKDVDILFTSTRNKDGASELQNSFYQYLSPNQES